MRKELIWKWLFFFVGLAVMSLGVSMVIKGKALGTGSWDVLHIALFENVGLTIGSWSVITGFVIVGSTSLLLKEWPKLATWLNMILCGPFIDFYSWILPDSTGIFFDVFYFLMGILVLGVGCGLYISPRLGAGPRDTLMMIFAKKFRGSIGRARLAMEALIALIGGLLGGPIGAGTLIIALCTGYVVQMSLPFFEKMLAKKLDNKDQDKDFSHKNLAKEL
ncbi:YczE/YyaS/YitT family protein [Ureibacillus aquaedulcis]|uniref:YitT family protein n=1 Tax=Ureibacillus aquaedulcis TaxID=3058421 RepID=A0ABT8GKT3_9BACL|nr:YitT family protein [Ureibacillus sp. BA0131]MDN4492025.1 YitT family protein [Ureibacillus sp. BA0131]